MLSRMYRSVCNMKDVSAPCCRRRLLCTSCMARAPHAAEPCARRQAGMRCGLQQLPGPAVGGNQATGVRRNAAGSTTTAWAAACLPQQGRPRHTAQSSIGSKRHAPPSCQQPATTQLQPGRRTEDIACTYMGERVPGRCFKWKASCAASPLQATTVLLRSDPAALPRRGAATANPPPPPPLSPAHGPPPPNNNNTHTHKPATLDCETSTMGATMAPCRHARGGSRLWWRTWRTHVCAGQGGGRSLGQNTDA